METETKRGMGTTMTDEERRKLCEWLHRGSVGWNGSQIIEPKMAQAANEIERLAGQLRTTLTMYGQRNKEIERLQNELRLWQEQG